MLSPLPCLTVGAATNRVARSNSLSMFCIRYRMDLGPLCYTGSLLSSRRVTFDNPDSTACRFGWSLNQPRMAPCSYSAYERLVSFDHVLRLWLSPGLRLPGLIHFREGSTPLAVAATQPAPARRMPPWNTCGDTQDLVRNFFGPSSTECNFMSQLTMHLTSVPPKMHDMKQKCNRRVH